ncbi:unnamed protein product [Durusdinium trenchii]|uniref:Casein kinase I n=2 Tax=Durusdinium trenchii TaxID=1381693 RepID=A0ABP0L388_9DINO
MFQELPWLTWTDADLADFDPDESRDPVSQVSAAAEGLHGPTAVHLAAHRARDAVHVTTSEPGQRLLLGVQTGQRVLLLDKDHPAVSAPSGIKVAVLWAVKPDDLLTQLPKHFAFGELLGQGQFSKVLEVTECATGRRCVAKTRLKTDTAAAELWHEAMALKILQKSSVFPEFLGLFVEGDMEFLVMERFLQSLEDFRLRCRGFFDAEVPLICSVGVQLLSQLEQMHRLNLSHGDLKTKNIAVAAVVASADGLTVRLIDFGCCRPYRVNGLYVSPPSDPRAPSRAPRCVGTTRYCARAAHDGERSPRCDLESLAYVLIYFATGRLPWHGCKGSSRENGMEMLRMKQEFSNLKSYVQESLPKRLATLLTRLAARCRDLTLEEEPPYEELRALLTPSPRASSRGQARGYANEVPASQPADTLTEGTSCKS